MLRPLLPLMAFAALVFQLSAKTEYNSRSLDTKAFFAKRENAAVNEAYVGVQTTEGIQEGLFAIESTGQSTATIVEAAQAFIASLSQAQKLKTQFGVQDPEWRRWFNVDSGIYVRQGVSMREMNSSQNAAAHQLMAATLSAKGMDLADAIRKTDQTLKELNDDDLQYGEDLYFFTLMGIPSATEPWGWQVDGHHLVINAFILGDQIVMTPTFLGGEPITATSGKYAGNSILQEEQNDGLAFMQLLTSEQQTAATLKTEKQRNDIQAEALKDNAVVDYAGVSAATFSPVQREAFLKLIHHYVGNLRDPHAEVWMDQISAHLDETRFAWVGSTEADTVFYYRIHSPVILIEFDHQSPVGTQMINTPRQPTRDHIHTIIRTPNGNDYGKDLLRQHLEKHHSDRN